ncbi:response regulator [Microbacterium oxydans]|jgi:two-component system CitB family response regulator|uniref:response regulator n=1 Tax=Microbacterium TaxID=33882 RepID=UPI000629B3F3|nr:MULTISPECIES: response regulator [Microbacterium]KAB1890761.1 response regulator [Microbacterium oxydans]KKX97596.1 chemotaxis protein CheY [Microbacterium sp. Ag1]KTR77742.1 chemotaxis protein CheY [Microbacterium oxydans]MBE7954189.1 response regulator [Microbacterium sp. R1]MCB8044751.1 response regulator [Microbacterium oxydans]
MTVPLRVLILDDDFRVAQLHQGIVEEHAGVGVAETVRSLAEARDSMRASRPDLLIADVFLPDGDGIALVRESGIDAILISAADDAPTVRRALRSGAVGYLVKPFERRALSGLLDRYVRYRNLLDGDRTLRQEDVDRALAILHGAGEPVSVSRSATEQLVLAALGDGERSAAEIGERVGISRATAQRHLAALAARAVVDVRLNYGSTGRPEHRYAARV